MFFTRVPLPAALTAWVGYSPAMLRGSARYFPMVGMAVGAVAAATYMTGAWLFTPAVAVVLSMIATILMTGAYFRRRIGSDTGDCPGAAQPVAEIACYLFAAGLLLRFEAAPAA